MSTEKKQTNESERKSAVNTVVILPCPFCGTKPKIEVGNEHCFIGGWSNDVKFDCCVTMSEGFGKYGNDTTTKEHAIETLIERWNARTK